MAFAHGTLVYEYIAGGPFNDEAYTYELREVAPRAIGGNIVHASGLTDTDIGFIPEDNDGEIWALYDKKAAGENDRWPSVVDEHFHGPLH